jgi:CRISPR-associated protein Cmr1
VAWHEFSIRFVTPAFLDDPATRPGPAPAGTTMVPFPVASLRGVLRYWLRAVIGAHVGNNLAQLSAVESAVFGNATGREGIPSPLRLRARERVPLTGDTPGWLPPAAAVEPRLDGSNVGYLLGQSLYDTGSGRLRRRCVPPDTAVDLAAASPHSDPDAALLFQAALWCLHTYGGLGARTRRGFGTIHVNPPRLASDFDTDLFDHTEDDNLPRIIEQTGAATRAVWHRLSAGGHLVFMGGTPRYPAFVADRYRQSDEPLDDANNLSEALALTGHQLREHRLDDESVTEEYRTLIAPYLNGDPVPATPFRLGAFGLPVPFSDSHGPNGTRRTAIVNTTIQRVPTRRASPLWLRIYTDSGAWYLRSLAFLSEWLPGTPQLMVTSKTRPTPKSLTPPSQAEVEAELHGWFSNRRPDPAPDTPTSPPQPSQPTPSRGPYPGSWIRPRPNA